MQDLLINTWYVAAPEADLAEGKPRRVRMLGLDFVLFRDAAGAIRCLSDVCCHRGGSLGQRDVTAGCVQCAYHGWRFNADGRCVEIPSLGDAGKIPKRARVDAYPVQCRYGLIWVFLGDLPVDERPALPNWLDAFEREPDKYWFMRYEKSQPGINWMRMMENSMDNSHLSFVHPMFGGRIDPRVSEMEITQTQWGAHTGLLMPTTDDSAKPEYMQKLLDKDREPLGVQLEFSLGGMAVIIRQNLAPGVTAVPADDKDAGRRAQYPDLRRAGAHLPDGCGARRENPRLPRARTGRGLCRGGPGQADVYAAIVDRGIAGGGRFPRGRLSPPL